MGCGASNSAVEPEPTSLASQTKTATNPQKSTQNKDIKASNSTTTAQNVPEKQNLDPPASSVIDFKEEGNDEPIKQKRELNSTNIPSKVPQVLFPITKPQLTDMNGELLNGRKLPKLNAIDPSIKKLPPITDKSLAFEVDLTKKRTNKRLPVQERLESNNKTQMTAEELKRRQEAANERRLQQQNQKVKKAKEALADIPERKQKLKDLEDKKTEELRLFLTEKRKLAETNKLQMENESKKRVTKELIRTQEIQMKAKIRKLEDNSTSNSLPNSIPGTRASSPTKTVSPDEQVIPTHLPKAESAPMQLETTPTLLNEVQANTEDVDTHAQKDSLGRSDSLIIQKDSSISYTDNLEDHFNSATIDTDVSNNRSFQEVVMDA